MAEGSEREGAGGLEDTARANEEHELEAEEESAEAMDAEVPQPPDSSQNAGGQSA